MYSGEANTRLVWAFFFTKQKQDLHGNTHTHTDHYRGQFDLHRTKGYGIRGVGVRERDEQSAGTARGTGSW